MRFKNAGFYFAGFVVMILIGFWPTYFSKFLNKTADFKTYFHFHAVTALLWVLFLIVQPTLIKFKKFRIHKIVGKISYLLVPVLFISILLLAHFRRESGEEDLAWKLWIPFKDIFIFTYGYLVAIIFRKFPPVHARGMIVAGMALIEPTMVRFVENVIGIPQPLGYYLGISPVYIVLLILIIFEHKESKARWVFPVAFIFFAFIHTVRIFKIILPFWEDFSHWFISLPLT